MRPRHPLFSPSSIFLTTIFGIVLAAIIWQSGGAMFSPGDLTSKSLPGVVMAGIASHSEIKECRLCHQPLQTRQDFLCLECHTQIQAELEDAGLHAQFATQEAQCFDCHRDHRGQDFDPTLSAAENFDHEITDFSLVWHQLNYDTTPLECMACHQRDGFSVSNQPCATCHTENLSDFMLQHEVDFGSNCLDCHDGVDRMTTLDHTTTGFPLDGGHFQVNCKACHLPPEFDQVTSNCATCHAEPAIHKDVFEPTCSECHTIQGWLPASLGDTIFDHDLQTRFNLVHHQLDYEGSPLNCKSCHTANLKTLNQETCTNCHAQKTTEFMQAHLEQFGSDCLTCHDGADRMEDFDHNTFFTIEGRHAEIECDVCHLEQTFAGTPQNCVDCHEEPPIHAGVFGLGCQNCHTSTAWVPASLLFHTFPLDHGDDGPIDCLTCHPTTYTAYTCNTCHDPDEMRDEHIDEGIVDIASRCVECHPTGLESEGPGSEGD